MPHRTSGPAILALLTTLAIVAAAPIRAQAPAAGDVRPGFFLPLSQSAVDSLGLDLPAADLVSLTRHGEAVRYHMTAPTATINPVPGLSAGINSRLAKAKSDMGMETLLVYPLPARLRNSPDTDLEIWRILHRISTMKGIEYFSASRGHMRTFFLKSTLVASAKDRKPLPDLVPATIEAGRTLYAVQEDSSFGTNLWRIDLSSLGSGTLSLRMTNVEQVWYGLVPVLSPETLAMEVILVRRGDWILFYGNAGLAVPRIMGIEEKAKSSFYNRLIALYRWFAGQLGT